MRRIRRSTWIALLIFLGALALYILFRPAGSAAPAGPASTTTTSTLAIAATAVAQSSR